MINWGYFALLEANNRQSNFREQARRDAIAQAIQTLRRPARRQEPVNEQRPQPMLRRGRA